MLVNLVSLNRELKCRGVHGLPLNQGLLLSTIKHLALIFIFYFFVGGLDNEQAGCPLHQRQLHPNAGLWPLPQWADPGDPGCFVTDAHSQVAGH